MASNRSDREDTIPMYDSVDLGMVVKVLQQTALSTLSPTGHLHTLTCVRAQ